MKHATEEMVAPRFKF